MNTRGHGLSKLRFGPWGASPEPCASKLRGRGWARRAGDAWVPSFPSYFFFKFIAPAAARPMASGLARLDHGNYQRPSAEPLYERCQTPPVGPSTVPAIEGSRKTAQPAIGWRKMK